MTILRIALIVLLLITGAAPAGAAESCEDGPHGPLVSPTFTPLAPAVFESLRKEMTMWDIVQRLGPAAREVGSGLIILEWDSVDGRVFRVGGASLCRTPLYARWEASREK